MRCLFQTCSLTAQLKNHGSSVWLVELMCWFYIKFFVYASCIWVILLIRKKRNQVCVLVNSWRKTPCSKSRDDPRVSATGALHENVALAALSWMLICSALKGANRLCEECWVVEVCGLASGWFRGEQEWDSGGQSRREVRIIWSNQEQEAWKCLPTERNRRGGGFEIQPGVD